MFFVFALYFSIFFIHECLGRIRSVLILLKLWFCSIDIINFTNKTSSSGFTIIANKNFKYYAKKYYPA